MRSMVPMSWRDGRCVRGEVEIELHASVRPTTTFVTLMCTRIFKRILWKSGGHGMEGKDQDRALDICCCMSWNNWYCVLICVQLDKPFDKLFVLWCNNYVLFKIYLFGFILDHLSYYLFDICMQMCKYIERIRALFWGSRWSNRALK